MNLKELAKKAYDDAAPQRAEQSANRIASTKRRLSELLKKAEIPFDPDGLRAFDDYKINPFIIIEGIRFELRSYQSSYSSRAYLGMEIECPRCKEVVYPEVDSLLRIGELFDNYSIGYPHTDGTCVTRKAEPTPTASEQLENIIREIAREEIPAG